MLQITVSRQARLLLGFQVYVNDKFVGYLFLISGNIPGNHRQNISNMQEGLQVFVLIYLTVTHLLIPSWPPQSNYLEKGTCYDNKQENNQKSSYQSVFEMPVLMMNTRLLAEAIRWYNVLAIEVSNVDLNTIHCHKTLVIKFVVC